MLKISRGFRLSVFFLLTALCLFTLVTGLRNWEQYQYEAVWAEEHHLSLSDRTIVVDAGHGGPDPGSLGFGVLEKDVNLKIALKLEELLRASGADVVMTRRDDRDLSGMPEGSPLRERKTRDLHARARVTESSNADILVSIHVNAIGSSQWYGGQTFYRADQANGQQSRHLARTIQEELIAITGNTKREASENIHQFILEQSPVPAVTIEVGFLSNEREARLLASEDYQRKVAWAIFVGIARYFASEPPEAERVSSHSSKNHVS